MANGDSPSARRRVRQEMTLQWTVQQQQQQQNSDVGRSAVAATSSADTLGVQHQSLPQSADYYDDEACSLVDSAAWHENDLILAAELGKALLERNRDLELQLTGLRGLCDHQAQEIELLGRQVQTLRGLNDGKARMVEEVDRQCAELEAQNRALLAERAASRERAACLAEQVAALEARVEELGQQLELERTAAAAAAAATTATEAACPHETEEVRAPLLAARTAALESELARQALEAERDRLELARLRRELAERPSTPPPRPPPPPPPPQPSVPPRRTPLKDAEEFEEFLELASPPLPTDGGVADDLTSRIESDVQHIGGDADCGQLSSGGTVFSSEEHLSRLGATRKLADTALSEVSLLTELNEQYNRLVVEYEQLLAGKKLLRVQACQTTAAAAAADDTAVAGSRSLFEQRLTGIFAEETRSERKRLVNQDYRPKYKDLFRDAMSKLRDMKNTSDGQT